MLDNKCGPPLPSDCFMNRVTYPRLMARLFESLQRTIDELLPDGSPRRKVVQVISVVLLFEGLSVAALYSYFGFALGAVSIVFGLVLMLLLHGHAPLPEDSSKPLGLRLLPRIFSMLGGEYIVVSLGVLIIALVVIFNTFVSSRPDYGDVDMITMLLGVLIAAYPMLSRVALVEASFALWFIGLVFLFLAAPQALTAVTGSADSSGVSDWYVEFMLATPFAESLNLLGIQASSIGNMVTIQFQDGTFHSLTISTYCAGLYSFSIFLSAFISFILVFERLPTRTLVVVVGLGLLAAYLGNLLRMIIIGVVGYYEGMDALLWAHRNVGWMIFLLWSTVFWYLIFRYVVRSGGREAAQPSDPPAD